MADDGKRVKAYQSPSAKHREDKNQLIRMLADKRKKYSNNVGSNKKSNRIRS